MDRYYRGHSFIACPIDASGKIQATNAKNVGSSARPLTPPRSGDGKQQILSSGESVCSSALSPFVNCGREIDAVSERGNEGYDIGNGVGLTRHQCSAATGCCRGVLSRSAAVGCRYAVRSGCADAVREISVIPSDVSVLRCSDHRGATAAPTESSAYC
jgi:hypothetical protein